MSIYIYENITLSPSVPAISNDVAVSSMTNRDILGGSWNSQTQELAIEWNSTLDAADKAILDTIVASNPQPSPQNYISLIDENGAEWKLRSDTSGQLNVNDNPVIDVAYGELFQNIENPVSFLVSNSTPSKWNAANAGAITTGASSNTTLDPNLGEIILDEDGLYQMDIAASVNSANPNVQLCVQGFLDDTGIDAVCDFPTTRSDGKYQAFGTTGFVQGAKGQKIGARYLALETADEEIKVRFQNVKVKKVK
jgi:hypothetical protein